MIDRERGTRTAQHSIASPSHRIASHRMAATLAYQVPGDDWGIYLVGAWKRTLECREFGRGYEHQRTSNSVVVVEQAQGVAAEPGTYVRGGVYVCVVGMIWWAAVAAAWGGGWL